MTIKDISYFSHKQPNHSDETGRSLIEMLGTIGIITMITVGAITGIGTSMTLWKANQTHEQVMELIQGISDLYSWRRNGWPDNFTSLCEDGGFSSCTDTNEIRFSLGDAPHIIGTAGERLAITITGVPFGAATHLQGQADGKIITSITCNDCNNGSRGRKTITFIHDKTDIE